MTLADFDKRLRRIESLLEQLTNQQPVDTTLDAEHMARLILEGKGKEIKQRQHLKLTGRAS